jgi:hypothetical protein
MGTAPAEIVYGAIRKRAKNYIITYYDSSGRRRWGTSGWASPEYRGTR